MRKRRRLEGLRVLRAQEGAAAMEFALLLPIFLTLSMGIVDFGRMMYTQEVLANASREGARQGILLTTPRPTESAIRTITENAIKELGQKAGPAIITVAGAGGTSGSDLQVTVDYLFDFWVVSRLIPGMPDTMTLRSSTVMKME